MCIALAVTRDGMPLRYEVLPGNRTDITTVEEIAEAMKARDGEAQRIWVNDVCELDVLVALCLDRFGLLLAHPDDPPRADIRKIRVSRVAAPWDIEPVASANDLGTEGIGSSQ